MSIRESIYEAYLRHAGNISATARELDVSRSTVRRHARQLDIYDKTISEGRLQAQATRRLKVPREGEIKRYILTSAQNNTKVNEQAWTSLMALRDHYQAELFCATFSYNLNAYGKLATKRGHAPSGGGDDLWFDARLMPFIDAGDDVNIELAPGLLWCGRANILPTAVRPLSGFETYGGRQSCIFPHAKVAMTSVPSGKFEATKLCYTTGTITQQNYIQKKAGLKAEAHHAYGAMVVEVDSKGRWWARQLQADRQGRIYDLDILADGETVTTGNPLRAVTWGDIHEAQMDPIARDLAWAKGGMLDTLRPNYQFMHDLVDFQSRRHHDRKNPHKLYQLFVDGVDSVEQELADAANFLTLAHRDWCKTVVVNSNHDNDFGRWLREADYREDPLNAEFFLEAQWMMYKSIRLGTDHHPIEWALRRANCPDDVQFLSEDESFVICKRYNGGIECGMHGHLGPNGSRASPLGLSKLGRAATTAHTHTACIIDDLYVAGITGELNQGYNDGPSSWSQSHVLTYQNARRAIVTLWDGKWRA